MPQDVTLWFIPGVVQLLWPYDSSKPYIVNDHFSYINHSGDMVSGAAASACLPAHFNNTESMTVIDAYIGDLHQNTTAVPLSVTAADIPAICPCTQTDACVLRTKVCAKVLLEANKDNSSWAGLRQSCQSNTFTGRSETGTSNGTCSTSGIHMGAGAALSKGLMEATSSKIEVSK